MHLLPLRRTVLGQGTYHKLLKGRCYSDAYLRWEPERLGVRTFDPTEAHRTGLEHRPGKVTPQKHTFSRDYFRSLSCRELLKVAWAGSVDMYENKGEFMAFARRSIRKGEVVEKGILRGIGMGILQDDVSNPYVFKLGQDFLIGTGFPWGQHSALPSPPFLASGTLMFYQRSASDFNVRVSVKESPVEGFEFDAVACEDIPAGTPLVRQVADLSKCAPMFSYADKCHMSDDQVDDFLTQCRQSDREKADLAGVEPEDLHETALRRHVEQTRLGHAPIIFNERTVVLPHPMWGGFGVFACQDIRAGDIVETGLMGQVNGLQGDKCPYIFTWNEGGKRYIDGRENAWCTGSGNSMFYNSDYPANVRMYRLIDHFRYVIVARTNIREGEEVMHLYASSSWRSCFVQDSNLPKLLPVEESSQGQLPSP